LIARFVSFDRVHCDTHTWCNISASLRCSRDVTRGDIYSRAGGGWHRTMIAGRSPSYANRLTCVSQSLFPVHCSSTHAHCGDSLSIVRGVSGVRCWCQPRLSSPATGAGAPTGRH